MPYKTKILQLLYIFLGLGLFLLPLIHAWMIYPLAIENINTSYSALGGILPWSDAHGYYEGANHFLENGYLNAWNTRRPLNAILFSMRLFLANYNFKIALILQALLCGLTCMLVARSISNTFGKVASVATLFILFVFASVFIPTTLSETLGLTLGCLAFVFLWEGVQSKHAGLFFSAGLLLMVGLNTRAGAFFILPLVIAWLGYHFRNIADHQRFNWKISFLFALGLLCGCVFNFLLIKLYADPTTGGAAHGNFALTLFGLVSGGKTWSYAYTAFPELSTMSEASQAPFLYAKSWETFRAQPWNLMLGILQGWAVLMKAILSFFQTAFPNIVIKSLVRITGAIILFFGLRNFIRLYRNHPDTFGLLSIALLGMFLSAAGIWTDGGFRVFAVTVPFFAAAVGIVCSSFFTKITSPQKSFLNQKFPPSWHIRTTYILGYLLLAGGLLGPLVTHAFQTEPSVIPVFSCAKHETPFISNHLSSAPYVDLSTKREQFSSNMLRLNFESKEAFSKILDARSQYSKAPAVLGIVRDAKTGTQQYVIAPTNIFANPHLWVGLCATKIPGNDTIMQIQSFEVLK